METYLIIQWIRLKFLIFLGVFTIKCGVAMGFVLQSDAFENGGEIPSKYTCEGVNVSPALHWHNPPAGTKCFALIVDDPDAPDPQDPQMTWVHWVVFNIPSQIFSLKENADVSSIGAQEGVNDWHKIGYGGPCPPRGRHRYFFKLYALSQEISGIVRPTKQELEAAMHSLILGKAEIVGTYQKKR